MIIPYGTDAPVYHLPWATSGLIAVNAGVFAWATFAGMPVDPYCLALGDGLHPLQWLTHMFLHADLPHVLGNLLFLWCFGLVVEGKVGWWRFLILYLVIGAAVGLVIQLAMLGGRPRLALGASAAIFGVLAIACVWAPRNEVHMVCVVYYRLWYFEVTILSAALCYFAWNGLLLLVNGFEVCGATGHLLGAAFGLALGVGLLWRRAVDCEGYDLLSVASGREGQAPVDPQAVHEQKIQAERRARLSAERVQDARPQVTVFLRQGNYDAAIRLFDKLHGLDNRVEWRQDELRALSRQLLEAREFERAIPFLEIYLRRWPDKSDSMRLRLAQILLHGQRRPVKAQRILATISRERLSAPQRDLLNRLLRTAQQMQAEGVVELWDE
jgi:membrane associated rhomboid family serine protease